MDKRNPKSEPSNENADWAAQVPQASPNKEGMEDYGWEKGESVLPEFRDPSVHEHAGHDTSGHATGQSQAPKSRQNRTASETF